VLLGSALSLNSCNSPYRRVTYHENPDYPLYHAVEKGNVAEAKRWVAWHRKNNQPIPDNLLFAAVNNTDKAMADLVLGLGLDWNKKLNSRYFFGDCNNYMRAKLYDRGYPVDPIRYDGASEFWLSAGFSYGEITDQYLEFLELMLSRGANINFVHNGQTALDTWQKTFEQYFAEVPFKPTIKYGPTYNNPEAWERNKSKMITFLRKHGGKLASELPKAANKPG